jgi:hypothetical protein
VSSPEEKEGAMSQTVGDDLQRETRAGGSRGFVVSRRRFLELGVAWAVGMASFVAAGCGGEEEDEGGEEDED